QTGESATAILTSGLPVRMEWVPAVRYGTALVRRTGAESHWRRLEALARERGLEGTLDALPAAEESELYSDVGLPWIPPELREDEGEIEAALDGSLPRHLVTVA